LALLLKHFEFVQALVLAIHKLQDFRSKSEQAAEDGAEKAPAKDVKHLFFQYCLCLCYAFVDSASIVNWVDATTTWVVAVRISIKATPNCRAEGDPPRSAVLVHVFDELKESQDPSVPDPIVPLCKVKRTS
jgi:hypothetical protein